MAKSAGPSNSYAKIYRVVKKIPEGRVATYGQVARIAGLAGHARQVGYALHAVPEEMDLPWHRVINAKGEISVRATPGSEPLQRVLLEDEGVEFRGQRVDMKRFGWKRKH